MNRLAPVFAVLLVSTFSAVLGADGNRAVINADRTNVRAKPSLNSEILASLHKGQAVEVFGEITPPNSKETWTRIAMPTAVTVWVSGPLVDARKGTVKAKVLNYRAGPGRNYSVLGKLDKGGPVKVIREFDGWVQIEPPANAVAFVASRLLGPATAASESTPAAAPRSAAPIETPPSAVPATPPQASDNNPAGTTTTPVVTTAPAPATESPTVPPPTTAEAVASPAPATTEPELAPVLLDSSTPEPTRPIPLGSPRDQGSQPSKVGRNGFVDQRPAVALPEPRFVVREGFVHSTLSPQAPTHYELRDGFYEEGVIDYLLLEPQKDLRKFDGNRVMVSGHEYHDSRWRTPVLKIQEIQMLP